MLWKIVVIGDVCSLCESKSHQVWLIVEYFDHVHMHEVDGLVFFHKIFKFFFPTSCPSFALDYPPIANWWH
jgi:hypothetical protein